MAFFGELFCFSIFAGMAGALLGIGGGIILLPFLTLVAGINLKYAAGASIVSVVATSSGASAAYLRDKFVNLRLGLLLNVSTVAGAVTGTFLTGVISVRALGAILGLVLLYSSVLMLSARDPTPLDKPAASGDDALDPAYDPWRLHNSYFDLELKREVHYRVEHVRPAFGVLYLVGVISGMLGIGSGAFKVLVMDKLMRLPIKVSTTTSNFMVGLNAAASAGMFFTRGDIHPAIAAPVALGILIGAPLGTRLLRVIPNLLLRRIFFVVLLIGGWQMLWKAWQGAIT
jgi:uncharacterized membrane protein YfcA